MYSIGIWDKVRDKKNPLSPPQDKKRDMTCEEMLETR
jgi:hypothetical protein